MNITLAQRLLASALTAAASLCALQINAAHLGEARRSGWIVVESVPKDSAGQAAGLMPGDLIRGSDAQGEYCILSPFDLEELERESARCGGVTVTVERDGCRFDVEMPPRGLGIMTSPQLPEAERALVQRALQVAEGKGFAEAASLFREAANSARVRADRPAAAWLNFFAGSYLVDAKQWEVAIPDYCAAFDMSNGASHPFSGVKVLLSQAYAMRKAGRVEEAEAAYWTALSLRRESAGESLVGANILHNIGLLRQDAGEYGQAEAFYSGSLAISSKLAPGCLQAADSLNNLGVLANRRGDLASADIYYREAISIRERLAPDSLPQAQALNNLGIIARNRGDLAAAEELYGRALKLFERLGVGGANLATIWNNLGAVTHFRGNLVKAETCFRNALAILEKEPPGQLRAAVLQNLGNIARLRGELELATNYYEKALALKQRLSSDELSVATTLGNLGVVAKETGDFKLAGQYYLKAQDIYEKVAPGSLRCATNLNNLGNVAKNEGDLARAESYYRKSLEIKSRLAPGSLDEAVCLDNLAYLASSRGDSQAAEAILLKCLEIRQRFAPGTAEEAETLRDLGELEEARGDTRAAIGRFKSAVDSLEAYRGRLGGGFEVAQDFSATYADIYRDLVRLQVLSGLDEEAFFTMERFRARTLLEMLAERDLDFSKDAPTEILEEQRRADHDYGSLQEKLAALNPATEGAKIDEIGVDLLVARERQMAVREKIRQASPKLAGLEYPKPLDLNGAAKILPTGALFLSYCTGKESTLIFALLDGKFRVEKVGLGKEQLTRKVRFYREILLDPSQAELSLKMEGDLFGALLSPIEDLLERSGTVLLCPDGPLYALPFAALRDREGRHLVERAAVVTALSATVLSEIGQGRRAGRPASLVAFGDPVPPVGNLWPGRPDFEPLPGARREVEAIGQIYVGNSDIWLGAQASEDRAKTIGTGPTLIHFSCHGVTDERRPLDSALVLSPAPGGGGEGDSGYLQAWEIFESLKLDADLVTLSACQTGLGKEMGGEGLIGLTRAFQYAGARSVLASLWSVSDESTLVLMKSFYGNLKLGKPKAEALRLAQLDLIQGAAGSLSRGRSNRGLETAPTRTHPSSRDHQPDYSHPFYWAGFVLNGDWR